MERLSVMVQTAQRASRTEPKKKIVNTKLHSRIQVNTDDVKVRKMCSGLALPVVFHASGHYTSGTGCASAHEKFRSTMKLGNQSRIKTRKNELNVQSDCTDYRRDYNYGRCVHFHQKQLV